MKELHDIKALSETEKQLLFKEIAAGDIHALSQEPVKSYLKQSVKLGLIDVAKAIRNSKLDRRVEKGSPVHIAIILGINNNQLEFVKELLCLENCTPLILSSEISSTALVDSLSRALYWKTADKDAAAGQENKIKSDRMALLAIIILNYFIAQSKINPELGTIDLTYQDQDGNSPLKLALELEHLGLVKFLINVGASVHEQYYRVIKYNNSIVTSTPLEIALNKSNLAIVKCLLENRASIDVKPNGQGGQSFLFLCVFIGKDKNILKILFEHATLDQLLKIEQDGKCLFAAAIECALRWGNLDSIHLLFQAVQEKGGQQAVGKLINKRGSIVMKMCCESTSEHAPLVTSFLISLDISLDVNALTKNNNLREVVYIAGKIVTQDSIDAAKKQLESIPLSEKINKANQEYVIERSKICAEGNSLDHDLKYRNELLRAVVTGNVERVLSLVSIGVDVNFGGLCFTSKVGEPPQEYLKLGEAYYPVDWVTPLQFTLMQEPPNVFMFLLLRNLNANMLRADEHSQQSPHIVPLIERIFLQGYKYSIVRRLVEDEINKNGPAVVKVHQTKEDQDIKNALWLYMGGKQDKENNVTEDSANIQPSAVTPRNCN